MNKDTDLTGEALLLAWEGIRNRGLTQEMHARALGIEYTIYKSRYYRAMANRQFAKQMDDVPDFSGFDRPELYDWSLPSEWVFDWDDFMVVGDVQLPTTDYNMAVLPAYIANNHLSKPRRLIIAGDFWNFDAYSKYDNIIKLPGYKDEQNAARNLLALWALTFDEMWMITGNHEVRKLKHDRGEGDINDIMAVVSPHGKVKATVRDKCTVNTSQGKYSVIHGASYRKIPLSTANELAQKFHSHIILHHEHHAAVGMDIYDRYFIVNNGGLFDIDKMAYVQLQTSARAGMSQGFTMVKGGYPYLFGKMTNWFDWL